jgi:hypothetical protein
MKKSNRVRSAADASDERVWQATFGLFHLLARLIADDALKVAHHGGIGMRTRRRANAIKRVVHVGDPVAQRFVHGVLEGLCARLHGHDRRAEHLHAKHVRLLSFDVHSAHVDDAFKTIFRASRRRRDAMLSRARLGDDALLAHASRQKNLAEDVVDLVSAGMIELVALEVNLRAAEMIGHALGEIERARSPDIVRGEMREFRVERWVGLGDAIGFLKLENQRHERFRDEPPAENAEMTGGVGTRPE